MLKPIKIGITMGDPAGIGPEVILKVLAAFEADENRPLVEPILFGDRRVFEMAAEKLSLKIKFYSAQNGNDLSKITDAFAIISDPRWVLNRDEIVPGKPTVKGAELSFLALKDAVHAIREEWIEAIVTAPIDKTNIAKIEPGFSGHTEYLAKEFKVQNAIMLFDSKDLRIALVTNHVALKDVSDLITSNRVFQTIRQTHRALENEFNLEKPKLAVLAMNPHGGESSFSGQGEDSRIALAVKEAQLEGLSVRGPYSADGFFGEYFHREKTRKVDAVVAMYHDQGLIPVKMHGFHDSTNITLGLPFVRTSVSHGVAYDIAGTGTANPQSLFRAIIVAANLVKRRRKAR
jgi:4-hydroxythreonine-4-phosphate dehydrogenase